jgi:hypothetical protein
VGQLRNDRWPGGYEHQCKAKEKDMGRLKDYYHDEITRDIDDEKAYEMWIQEEQQREYMKDWQNSKDSESNLDLVRGLAVVFTVALAVYGVGVVVSAIF